MISTMRMYYSSIQHALSDCEHSNINKFEVPFCRCATSFSIKETRTNPQQDEQGMTRCLLLVAAVAIVFATAGADLPSYKHGWGLFNRKGESSAPSYPQNLM